MGEIEFPNWDPVLLDLPGPFDIRWYGLMYVVAFLVGHHILRRMARSRFFPLPEEKVGDLIFMLIFGVILGGRIGFILFYRPEYLASWEALRIWEGGLSFHGGLIGVAITVIWFARRNQIPILRLGDCVAMATTPGILCVRLANFINSELYGRVVVNPDSVPWAMRFPRDPIAERELGLDYFGSIRTKELMIQYAYDRSDENWQRLLEGTDKDQHAQMEALRGGLNWETAKAEVPLRHPSQLYEGLAEGALLGVILWLLYRKTRGGLAAGIYFAVFLGGYGLFRWFLEFYRQPDVGVAHVLGMTRGQLLCTGMVVVAALLFWVAPRCRQPEAPEPTETANASQRSEAPEPPDAPAQETSESVQS